MSETAALDVALPATFEGMVAQLNSIDALISANKWLRAAIVAAYVRPDATATNRRYLDRFNQAQELSTAGRFSAREFAEAGIAGLTSHATVTRYLRAWTEHHKGAQPRPGETVRLPDVPFPPASKAPKPRCHERAQRKRPPRQYDAVLSELNRYRDELGDPEFRRWCVDNVTKARADDSALIADRIRWAMAILAVSLREQRDIDSELF